LVVDEVLSVGDEEFQRKSFQKFLEFRKRGKTVILVTHSMDVVREVCDSATWINNGLMMRTGLASDVVASYQSSFN